MIETMGIVLAGGAAVVTAVIAGYQIGKNGKYVREETCLRRHTEIVTKLDVIDARSGETAQSVSFIRGKLEG